jgi:hypothetical protein
MWGWCSRRKWVRPAKSDMRQKLKERTERKEPGASPLSLLRVAIEAGVGDMLGRQGGAGDRDVLGGQGEEAADFSSSLVERRRHVLAAILCSLRLSHRLGVATGTCPSGLGVATAADEAGASMPGLNLIAMGSAGRGPHQ